MNMTYSVLRVNKKEFIPIDHELAIGKDKKLFRWVVKTYIFGDPEFPSCRRYARNAILRLFGIPTNRNPFVAPNFKNLFTAADDFVPMMTPEELLNLFEDCIQTIGAPKRGKVVAKPVKPEDFAANGTGNWLVRLLEIFGVIIETHREHLSDPIYAKMFQWYIRIYRDNTAFMDKEMIMPWVIRNLTMLTLAYLQTSDIENAVKKILEFIAGATLDKESSDEVACLVLKAILPLKHDDLREFIVHTAYRLIHNLLGKEKIENAIMEGCDIGTFMPEQLLKLTKNFMDSKPTIKKWKAFVRASMCCLIFTEIPELTQDNNIIQEAIQGLADQWETFAERPEARELLPGAGSMDFSLAQKNCRDFSQSHALKLHRTFHLDAKQGVNDANEDAFVSEGDVAE